MEDFKVTYCKLCLSTISNETQEPIPIGIIAYVNLHLGVPLSNVNFDDKNKHVVCNTCSARLLAAQTFKMACLSTDTAISSCVDDTTTYPLDIREIYLKERKSEGVSGDVKICRLCMHPIINLSEFKSINEEQVDMIQKFIPEMNIFIIREPVMCSICLDSLLEHSNFLEKCAAVEKNNANISKGQVPYAPSPVPSVDIPVKIENVDDEFEKDVPEFIKTELLDIKYEEVENESEMQFPTHEDTSEVQMYKCTSCSYETKYQMNLKSHMLKHKPPSEAKKYKCELCDFEANFKDKLKIHLMKHEDPLGVQMYKCEKCDYESMYKKYLKRHMMVHKDPLEMQMYKCEVCNYETKYMAVLKNHMLIHKDPSDMRMYKCEFCQYETMYKSGFDAHRCTHRDPVDKRIYKCQICDYGTKRKGNFKTHMLKHKDPSEVLMFKCEKCNYETRYKTVYKRHVLIHKE